jgi:hypothetical protein
MHTYNRHQKRTLRSSGDATAARPWRPQHCVRQDTRLHTRAKEREIVCVRVYGCQYVCIHVYRYFCCESVPCQHVIVLGCASECACTYHVHHLCIVPVRIMCIIYVLCLYPSCASSMHRACTYHGLVSICHPVWRLAHVKEQPTSHMCVCMCVPTHTHTLNMKQ